MKLDNLDLSIIDILRFMSIYQCIIDKLICCCDLNDTDYRFLSILEEYSYYLDDYFVDEKEV